VLSGLFSVAHKLYGIDVKEVTGQDLWHPDARYFEIYQNGQKTAAFYLDLYSREGKRGGAWMDDCRVRRQTASGLQLPVAFLVCNFNGPVGDKPALLTHSDVTTLFHEFGHGLHHMMTQMDVAAVSGINGVEWDAVELPSQIMENWAWEPEVLKTLSAHVDTGAALPDALIEKMMAAKNFQSGMFLVRQVEFALFDMQLHAHYGTPGFKGIQATLDEVRSKVSVIKPPSFNRFQNSFSHIFAGGYSAGYYSYLWAEVLSADAYSAFEESGIFNPETGQRFLQEILSQGGSQSAAVLFKNFRGRDPEVDALLRHSGITA
jgi:oligopeptidase A